MKIIGPLAENGKINSEASIRDRQSIIINAEIDVIWKVLTDIANWPSWNKHIKSISGNTLEVGSQFEWSLNGIHIHSIVKKVTPPEQIAWTGTSLGVKAIYVWNLEKSDNQTIVTAEESLQGLRTIFLGHQKIHNTLINWLEFLKQRVENS